MKAQGAFARVNSSRWPLQLAANFYRHPERAYLFGVTGTNELQLHLIEAVLGGR